MIGKLTNLNRVQRIAILLIATSIWFAIDILVFQNIYDFNLVQNISKLMVEIVVAIAVYFLIEYIRFEIPKNVGLRNHENILKEFQNDKKTFSEIKILDTAISNFIKNPDLFKKSITAALKNTEVKKIKILLLHPDTYAAKQRRDDLSGATRKFLMEMRKGLYDLFELIETIKKDGEIDISKIEIRLFSTTPTMIYASWGATANFGLLPPHMVADDEETFNIHTKTPFGKYLIKYFEKIWEKANIKMEDYLFVEIVNDQGPPISNIVWGGTVEDREIPKYLVRSLSEYDMEKLCREGKSLRIKHDKKIKSGKLVNRFKGNSKYLKERIGITYGNMEIAGNCPVYEINYSHEIYDIKLSDPYEVNRKINKDGYYFVSHKHYDIHFNAKMWDSLDSIFYCFSTEDLLDVDQCDYEAMKARQNREEGYKTHPRERLFMKFECILSCGNLILNPINDGKYPVPYKISHASRVIYEKKERDLPIFEEKRKKILLRDDDSSKTTAKHMLSTLTLIRSTIRTDLLYLLGIDTFIKEKERKFNVYVHLIKTKVSSEIPLSEQRDDELNTHYDYKVIHLITRNNIVGGANYIVFKPSEKGKDDAYLVLEEPLDAVFFRNKIKSEENDEELDIFRRIAPIELAKGEEGFRGVLVLEFKEQ